MSVSTHAAPASSRLTRLRGAVNRLPLVPLAAVAALVVAFDVLVVVSSIR